MPKKQKPSQGRKGGGSARPPKQSNGKGDTLSRRPPRVPGR